MAASSIPGCDSSTSNHRLGDVGWRRFTWDLHSAMGFWGLAFIVLFALSGVYLSNPQFFQDLVDRFCSKTNLRRKPHPY